MIEQLSTIFSYEFMRNALLASMWISLACGIVGTLVVLNRIVSLSGGIAHAPTAGLVWLTIWVRTPCWARCFSAPFQPW